jgi:hypothetical protein
MKMGLDALRTAENESGIAKHENGTRHPQYRRKRVWGCKIGKQDPTPTEPPKTSPGTQYKNTGSDASAIAENESRSKKHENGTRRPRYRRKQDRERKT